MHDKEILQYCRCHQSRGLRNQGCLVCLWFSKCFKTLCTWLVLLIEACQASGFPQASCGCSVVKIHPFLWTWYFLNTLMEILQIRYKTLAWTWGWTEFNLIDRAQRPRWPHISTILWVFKFGTNVSLDSRMSCLDFDGRPSLTNKNHSSKSTKSAPASISAVLTFKKRSIWHKKGDIHVSYSDVF